MRQDEASLATNRARSGMFVEAWALGSFGTRDGGFYLLHLVVQTGRRRQLGGQGEALSRAPLATCWGKTGSGSRGDSPAGLSRSISEPVAGCIPAQDGSHGWEGVSPENDVGPGATRGLALCVIRPRCV